MMLRVEGLCCGYGGPPVVRDISFAVSEGRRLCLLGPNGCGKTTLLRALAGLLPCEGRVLVGGVPLASLPARERAKRVGLLSQLAPPSGFAYTVYETVMLGRYAHQRGALPAGESEADRRLVRQSLERTGTWPLRDRRITELSGGQLQRVFLARTFAQDPAVILLDEPTNHLDLPFQAALLEDLRGWVQAGGRCVVAVLHDPSLALAFADELLLMKDGRLAGGGPASAFDLGQLDDVYGMDVRGWMRASLARWR